MLLVTGSHKDAPHGLGVPERREKSVLFAKIR